MIFDQKFKIMKKTTLLSFAFMLISTFLILSCGSDAASKSEKKDDDNNVSINIGGEDGFHLKVKGDDGENVSIDLNSDDLEKGINQLINSEDLELVNFREMKALLPTSLRGMERTSIEGQKSGIGKLKAATAEATYRNDDEKIDISLVDVGGLGMMMSTIAGWANVEVDNESDHGYERTTTIDGYKAFESYDSNSKEGSIAIIVEDRIIVSIEGENITERQLKKALNAISLRKLKRLIP